MPSAIISFGETMLLLPVPKSLSVLYWEESLEELINFITRKDESVTMATLVERIFAHPPHHKRLDRFIHQSLQCLISRNQEGK
jgi:hypothetical protein